MSERVVVVGAGECGTRGATALREGGFAGPVTVLGGEEVAAYERPPLSKGVFGVEAPLVHPWSAEHLSGAGVDLRLGVEVTAVDRPGRVVRTSAGEVGYDRLLLATGSRVRRVEALGDDVAYLRTHEDAAAIRRLARPGGRLLVVGAGLIGLEVAASAREAGMEVVVVEAADRPLARVVPAPVADEVVALHRAKGVDLRLGATVGELGSAGEGGRRVTLSDGWVGEVDGVVAGTGAEPAAELAEASGLELDPDIGGVVVDAQLRTADPRVWAAGDVAAYPDPWTGRRVRVESWRSAHETAQTAAASMLGQSVPHAAVPWLWSEQHGLMLQVSGVPAAADTWVVRVREDGVRVHLGLLPDGRVAAAAALGPGPVVAREIRAVERLVTARATPSPEVLADPSVSLRSLA